MAALTGRAKVRAATGDVTAAIGDYRSAVGRQPQPQFLVQFGELLEADGQSQAAEEQYEVVRAIQQLFAAAGQDVDTELAVFEADHGDPAAAVASAERAYRARPDAIFTQDAAVTHRAEAGLRARGTRRHDAAGDGTSVMALSGHTSPASSGVRKEHGAAADRTAGRARACPLPPALGQLTTTANRRTP